MLFWETNSNMSKNVDVTKSLITALLTRTWSNLVSRSSSNSSRSSSESRETEWERSALWRNRPCLYMIQHKYQWVMVVLLPFFSALQSTSEWKWTQLAELWHEKHPEGPVRADSRLIEGEMPASGKSTRSNIFQTPLASNNDGSRWKNLQSSPAALQVLTRCISPGSRTEPFTERKGQIVCATTVRKKTTWYFLPTE